MDTELALAVSARDWADVLHRFLTDHGGARVRVTAMGPEELSAEGFDVLLIDDTCSFLTPRLVREVTRSGRAVVGVYDPEVFPDGKQRLLECGVTDVVEAGASPDEFLRAVGRVARTTGTSEASGVSVPIRESPSTSREGLLVAVGGPSGGVGSTEVAMAVALCLAEDGRSVVLVDGDARSPSLAPRLGLPLHPNIRTAVDAVEHRTVPVQRLLHGVGALRVLTGLPAPSDEVRPRQILDVVSELRRAASHVVVDIGSGTARVGDGGFGGPLVEAADRVVGVAAPTPVGIIRVLDWVAAMSSIRPEGSIDLLINRAPRERFRRGEIVEEITRSYVPSSFSFLPDDQVVSRASWDGVPVPQGVFKKAVGRWVRRFGVRA